MRVSARARAAAVATTTLLLVAACSDGRDASSLTGVRNVANDQHGETLDAQVTALITQLWAPSTNTAPALLSWWTTLKQKVARQDPRAGQMLLDLTALVQGRTDRITPRPNETKQQSAAHLVLLMSLYVHAGPNTPPPAVPPQAEATLAVVSPAEEQTVQTPSEESGVLFPANAVNTPTIVVITKTENSEYPQECAGPLPTTRCQYPAFYKFNVFPDVKLNSPALVAVCREENGDTRMPRASHDRFRLAHQKPDNPAAYNPHGYIEGDIEVLPLASASNIVNCPHTHEEEPDPENFLAHLGWRVRNALTPKLLFAIDRGGGGAVFMFSDFAMIDPESQADLYVAGYFSASASTIARGGSLTVNLVSKSNDGTGPAGPHVDKILLATDPGLSEGVIELATVNQTGLNPTVNQNITQIVTIAESVPAGNYWIGVRLDANGGVNELDEENNVVSAALTVGDPNTLFCPDGPEGSYNTLQEAVDAAGVGGTVLVCNGFHQMDDVVINKPLTLRSQNPGGATLGNTAGVNPAGQSGPSVLRVHSIPSGLVRIEDLGFQLRNHAVVAQGTFDDIQVHNVRVTIDPAFTAPPSIIAIEVLSQTSPGSEVNVTNSEFTGLQLGVFSVGTGQVNVRHSEFSNHSGGSVVYSNQTSTGTVEYNTFTNCGSAGCIRVLNAGNTRIAHNEFFAGPNGVGLGAITVTLFTPGPHGPVIVEDNRVHGERTESAPDLAAGYRIVAGVFLQDAAGVSHVIRRNVIETTHRGLDLGGDAVAHDNTVTDGFYAIVQTPRNVVVNRNDFTGNIRWFQWAQGGNYQCNWWGTNGAPPANAVQPPTTHPSVYEPRASGPIANTTTPCFPGPIDTDGPVHLFAFGSNGANADVGGSTGTLQGGASINAQGMLSLNGESAYEQVNQRVVPTTGSFTVEMFARQSVMQTNHVELISQGVSGSGFYLGHDPSRIIRATDSWLSTGIAFPNDGNEHHYALSYDVIYNMTRLYVDGVERAAQAGNVVRGVSGSLTRFGKQFDPHAENFSGLIDNVGVHGSALSAADIARLANRGPDLACSAEGSIQSGAGIASTVVFENRSGETLRIEWLDFSGNRVLYAMLPNGASYPQGTFVSHPWIITGVSSSHCYGIWRPVQKGRIVTIFPSD